MNKVVFKYLDVNLKNSWTVLYYPSFEETWIIDMDTKDWIMKYNTKEQNLVVAEEIASEVAKITSIPLKSIDYNFMEWFHSRFNLTIRTSLIKSNHWYNEESITNLIDVSKKIKNPLVTEDISAQEKLIRDRKNVFKYLDIQLKHRWVLIDLPEQETKVVLDKESEEWIIDYNLFLQTCYINRAFINDIKNIFDMDFFHVLTYIGEWIDENFKELIGDDRPNYDYMSSMNSDRRESAINKFRKQKIKEQKLYKLTEEIEELGSPNLKYYAFDWDDNIVVMPTRIMVLDKEGNEIGIKTEEYAKFREFIGKQEIDYNGKTIVDYAPDAFRKFKISGDKDFLIDALLAKPGPSWSDFVESINGGSIFAIITARGHSPQTIKEAVYNYIISNYNGINKKELVKNLRKYRDLADEEDMNDTDLIREYLNLCKFYPVSYGQENEINPEEAKVKALKEFSHYVKEVSGKLNQKAYIKNNVKNYFIPVIGFSDDDIKNIESIKSNFKNQSNIKTFYTGKGTKEQY